MASNTLNPNALLYTLLGTPVLIFIVAWVFQYFQNHKKLVGGAISTPKSLWLSYTVISWFLTPILFLFIEVNPTISLLIKIHLLSFWLRGLVELVMIYKFFNWSPRYGIAHSGGHAVFLFCAIVYQLIEKPALMSLNDKVALTFVLSLFICVCFEVLFAVLFFKVRSHSNYQEKHKIYFASDEPQWNKINKLTRVAVALGLSGYAISAGLLLS